jgi:hypothetical protein
MSGDKQFGQLEIPESDGRFETVSALLNNTSNTVHHDRFSLKYGSTEHRNLVAVVVQPFVEPDTPHGRMGIQLDPGQISDYVTAMQELEFEVRDNGV